MALGPATGPYYDGPPEANELAGWRQFLPPLSKVYAFVAPVGEPHSLTGQRWQ